MVVELLSYGHSNNLIFLHLCLTAPPHFIEFVSSYLLWIKCLCFLANFTILEAQANTDNAAK